MAKILTKTLPEIGAFSGLNPASGVPQKRMALYGNCHRTVSDGEETA